MGAQLDAINPANIPATLNGQMALRVTVLANPIGQAFDVERGDAPADQAARAIATRLGRHQWAIVYFAEATQAAAVAALAAVGVQLAPAGDWPAPKCYLWAADPSGNIAAGRWVPPVAPLLVQDQWGTLTDHSTTFAGFPSQVAGYLDGPASAWPVSSWQRFTYIPDASPGTPPGTPTPTTNGGQMAEQWIVSIAGKEYLTDGFQYRYLTSPADTTAQLARGALPGEGLPNAVPMGYAMTAADAAEAGDGRPRT